jgi:hypothetical protein
MNRTKEQTNASQPLDQAGWIPRHSVREACRAEFRAWCRAVGRHSATQWHWGHSHDISSAEPGFWR